MQWVLLTLLAAGMQAVRTAGQKQMAKSVDAATVSWVRFLFGLPFAMIMYFWVVPDTVEIIALPWLYWLYVLIVALSQLLATLLAVMLLGRRNFAVGSTLVKSEAIFTALLGIMLFSEHLNSLAWLAVILGIAGLIVASLGRFDLSPGKLLSNLDSTSAWMGLAGGALFGIASVFIRQANLILSALQAPIAQAVITLCCVMTLQTIIGGIFVLAKKPDCLKQISTNLPICIFIGLTSMLGSLGWFGAYAFQNAAYVKTLGQIEFVFTLLITWFYFREKIRLHEYIAIAMIVVSAIVIVWTD